MLKRLGLFLRQEEFIFTALPIYTFTVFMLIAVTLATDTSATGMLKDLMLLLFAPVCACAAGYLAVQLRRCRNG